MVVIARLASFTILGLYLMYTVQRVIVDVVYMTMP